MKMEGRSSYSFNNANVDEVKPESKSTVTYTTIAYQSQCRDINKLFQNAKEHRIQLKFTKAEYIYREIIKRIKENDQAAQVNVLTKREKRLIRAEALCYIGICRIKQEKNNIDKLKDALNIFEESYKFAKGSLHKVQEHELLGKIYYYTGYLLPKLDPSKPDLSENKELTTNQRKKCLGESKIFSYVHNFEKRCDLCSFKGTIQSTKTTFKAIPYEKATIPKAYKEKLRKVLKKNNYKSYRKTFNQESEYSVCARWFLTINKRAKYLYSVAREKGQLLSRSKSNKDCVDQYMRVKYGFKGISDVVMDEGIVTRTVRKTGIHVKKNLGSLIQSTKEISACKTELGKTLRKLKEYKKSYKELKQALRIQYENHRFSDRAKPEIPIQIIYIHMADAKKDESKWNDVVAILKEFFTNFTDPNNSRMNPAHMLDLQKLMLNWKTMIGLLNIPR